MNSTKRLKKNEIVILVLLFSFSLIQVACLVPKSEHLKVIVHLERKNFTQSSLLVFNFIEPSYANGFGSFIAERFHLNLLHSKTFSVVGLQNDSPWNRLGNTEEERLLNALEECRNRQFDYIMVGEIKDYFDGGINRSRLSLKVRIIDVKTRITVFLAENNLENQGKDPSYPMATKLSKPSKQPKELAEKLIEEFIKAI